MTVAVILLTWNAADAALTCLHSLVAQQHAPEYILVVDNDSHDGTAERVAEFITQHPTIMLLRNATNLGFSGGMNVGINRMQTLPEPPDIVVLLNQDTTLAPTWLAEIIAPFADERVGAVGCKIYYPDGTLQHAGVYLDMPRAVAHHVGWHEQDTGQYDEQMTYDLVTGAAIAVRVDALQQVGIFDTGYAPAYYEDVDLCWRLRHYDYRIVYAPRAEVVHHESLSLHDERTRSGYYNRGRLRFVLKTTPIDAVLTHFYESELTFIQQHCHAKEGRVLRWAYTETIAYLDDILETRSTFFPAITAHEKNAIITMFSQLQHAVVAAAYQRAYALIDAFYAV